jgi:ABC-type hemin transport system ATPase subunit
LQVIRQTVQDSRKLPSLVHARSRDAVAVNDEPTTVLDIERRMQALVARLALVY